MFVIACGRQNDDAFQRYPPPNSLEPVNSLGYVAEGIKVADGVEVACQLTLNKEMVLDYMGGPLSQGDPMLDSPWNLEKTRRWILPENL